mmetsp:Transcript_96830/g.283061  ORF Transcript_96830/g.283061 Transcript_96830/m.283061 type:complete len:250 (-) Transcript_96830:103-852(-)
MNRSSLPPASSSTSAWTHCMDCRSRWMVRSAAAVSAARKTASVAGAWPALKYARLISAFRPPALTGSGPKAGELHMKCSRQARSSCGVAVGVSSGVGRGAGAGRGAGEKATYPVAHGPGAAAGVAEVEHVAELVADAACAAAAGDGLKTGASGRSWDFEGADESAVEVAVAVAVGVAALGASLSSPGSLTARREPSLSAPSARTRRMRNALSCACRTAQHRTRSLRRAALVGPIRIAPDPSTQLLALSH